MGIKKLKRKASEADTDVSSLEEKRKATEGDGDVLSLKEKRKALEDKSGTQSSKEKRKASEDDGDIPSSNEMVNSSTSQPPKKKHKGLSTEEFIVALQGPNGSEAVREWLYMISSEREKLWMDIALSRQKAEKRAQREKDQQEQSTKENGNDEDIDKAEEMDIEKDQKMTEEKDGEKVEDESEDLVKNKCAGHIDGFLASGGSVKDIIGTLPAPELVEKVSQIKYTFRTLFKVLVRISANHHNKVPEAVEACRELLHSYSKCINDMLKRQREPSVFLELLTAMVALDSKFAKEVLNNLTLDADIVENLTSLRAPLLSRVAYLKFLVALLIDPDSSLLMTVAHMPWVLTCIMEGLQYDPSNIVVMYLMTIKKAIVDNPSILKTTKLTIFTPDVIISLLYLYKWKGPQNRPKTKSLAFWAMKKIVDKPKMQNEINSEEADLVSSAVHELLLVLLTSHRYGIIFGDTQQTDRNNVSVSNVLQRVGHPWGDPKVADLISKALAACPDSLEPTMKTIEPFIQPRSSPQWFNCARFLCKVLEDQRPEEILRHQLPMKMLTLATASINMCIPISVVRALNAKEAQAFCNEDIVVAKTSLDLFVCMLRKAVSFLKVVRQWVSQKVISYAQSTTYHVNFTKYIRENVPSLSSIQKAWQLWSSKLSETEIMGTDDERSARPINMLSLLLEVLELYFRLCPSILYPLRPAQSDFKASLTNVVLKDLNSEDIALLRNRLFQLLLTIKDDNFVVENNELRNLISIVYQDLISSSASVSGLASSVLQTLIKRSGSLEGSSQEAIIWLSNFQETFSDKKECSVAVAILVESMIRACVSCPKYLDIIAGAEDEAGKMIDKYSSSTLKLSDGRTLQELFDDLAENKDEQLACNVLNRTAKLSPWLPAFLEVLRENISEKKLKRQQRQAVEEFCCKVILRLLCRFPHSGAFLHLVLHAYPDVIPSKLSDYLKSWLPGGSPETVQLNLLGQDSAEFKLGTFLFSEEENASLQDIIKKLFVGLALPTMDDDSKENLSDIQRLKATCNVVQVVHFICFHLSQLAQLEKLTEGCVHKSQEMLIFIFDTATHFDQFGKKGKEGLFSECFKVILFHPFLYQQFNPLVKGRTKSSTLLTNLMMSILKKASTYVELQQYIVPYKRKLLDGLKSTAHKKKAPKENITNLVDSFQLKFQEISSILILISDLPSSTISVNSEGNHSQWLQLSEHLLIRASELRMKGSSDISETMVLPPSVVLQISNWIVDFLPNKSIDVTSLIEAFMLYIKSCPQQTIHISDRLLSCALITSRCSAAVNNLVKWIASSIPVKDLTAILKDNIDKKKDLDEHMHVILPLLREVLKENAESVKMPIVGDVYNCFRARIEGFIVKVANHPDWLAMNTDVVVLLMKRYMKQIERERVCKALEKRAPVLTKEKLYHLQLVTEILHIHQPQLLQILLAWLGIALKKYGNASDQAVFAKPLCEAVAKLLKEETQEDFSVVIQSKVWQETLRLVLKYALVAKEKEESDLACVLLKTLAIVFERVYSPQEDHEHVLMVHSMIIQHSEFINLMLSQNPCKFELIQFLYVLLKRNPKIMESSHAPVLLSAYNASLNKTDRALLKILMMYEQCGVDFSHYRPFFWGRQGADYYAIWSQAKSNRSLDKQLKPDEVLDLLKQSMVMDTIANFPLHSTFKIADAETESVGAVQVYDPSFYLPLFIYLLSPESLVLAHKFMRSGALAITLAALSSFDDAVRAAAYTVLSRYLSQLQMARGLNKEIAMQFLTVIQKGLSAFDCENPQLSSIVTVFLAKASMEIADPRGPLNKPLINFIFAKPELNLRTVPEFLVLMHSDHVDHLAHRHWILEVLKDGIKSTSDIFICMESVVFKLLLSFYSSCLSDSKSKLNILCCIESAVSIQYGACRLVRDYSLLSWIHQSILSSSVEDTPLIDTMVRLVSKLWESLSLPTKGKQDIPLVSNPASKMFHLLLALLVKLKASLSTDTLCLYVNVLSNLVPQLTAEDISLFTKHLLVSIIESMSSHCPDKRQFFDLIELGYNHVDISETSNSALDNNLRLLTIQWMKHKTESCTH